MGPGVGNNQCCVPQGTKLRADQLSQLSHGVHESSGCQIGLPEKWENMTIKSRQRSNLKSLQHALTCCRTAKSAARYRRDIGEACCYEVLQGCLKLTGMFQGGWFSRSHAHIKHRSVRTSPCRFNSKQHLRGTKRSAASSAQPRTPQIS
jgi:hypothetical protein